MDKLQTSYFKDFSRPSFRGKLVFDILLTVAICHSEIFLHCFSHGKNSIYHTSSAAWPCDWNLPNCVGSIFCQMLPRIQLPSVVCSWRRAGQTGLIGSLEPPNSGHTYVKPALQCCMLLKLLTASWATPGWCTGSWPELWATNAFQLWSTQSVRHGMSYPGLFRSSFDLSV